MEVILFIFAVALIDVTIGVVVHLRERKNKDTFRCDGCGKRFSLDIHGYYICENEMMCKYCYAALKAPYKMEPKQD